jgi:YggT family protein
MESIYSGLYTVTEPVLGPVRRALPPLGGFDLSPIVVIFGLQLLSRVIAGG